jgi:hypothetical protein
LQFIDARKFGKGTLAATGKANKSKPREIDIADSKLAGFRAECSTSFVFANERHFLWQMFWLPAGQVLSVRI